MGKFQVYWISPRGFSNEGDFVYGHKDQLEKEIDHLNMTHNYHSQLFQVSEHLTLENARKRATKEAKKAHLEYSPKFDQYTIGIREATKAQTQEDYELVKY